MPRPRAVADGRTGRRPGGLSAAKASPNAPCLFDASGGELPPTVSGYSFPPLLVAGATLGLLLAFETSAHALPPPVPGEPERPTESRPDAFPPPGSKLTVLGVGLGTLAGFYAPALTASLVWPDAPGGESLRYPVVGPWIALADTGCPDDNPDCSIVWPVFRAVLTSLDGVGQVGGVALVGEGIWLRTRRRSERQLGPLSVTLGHRPGQRVSLRPVPFLEGPQGMALPRNGATRSRLGRVGLGIVGQF